MDANAKRKEIERLYGNSKFRGRDLYSMPDNQIHAIYGRLVNSGKFIEYEMTKQSYINLFPNGIYEARKRANKMSIFELRKVIPQVIAIKEEEEPEGYQYTLYDWLDILGEGKTNGNS